MFVITFSFYVNNENSLNIIEKFFNEIKPNDIPFFKNSNNSCNLSFLGNKIFIDIVINDEQFLKPFLDLNIDFVDFHTFKASYKTEFVPRDFFVLTFDELIEKIITISFHFYSKTINGKYILLSLLKALQNVNKNKTINQIISYLYLFIGFIKHKFYFEYSSKEFCQCYLINKIKQFLNEENLDGYLIFAQFLIKFFLNYCDLLDLIKEIIHEYSMVFSFPKYKSGIVFIIKIPGITQLINEKLLD